MDKLRAIQLFVRLSEVGSFTALAEEKNLSKSMISKEISRLEDTIGARLFQRSTRHLQLTQIGEGYLTRCREVLLKLDDADSYVTENQSKPKGKLRINAPMALGLSDLDKLFADFMEAYPDIELDIQLGDDSLDLIEQGFDLGLRLASRQFDSNYIGKELATFSYRVCVAANYFDKHPPIKKQQDLKQHNCFIYSYFRGKNIWPLKDGIEVRGQLRVNSTPFLLESIRRGLGVGFIPNFVCDSSIKSGEIIEVLTNTPKPKLTLYALYPARQFVPAKLLHCVNFLTEWYSENKVNRL